MADYRAAARRAARREGLDPDVFERQIQQESGFSPTVRSPAGATGIAQIMPATARGWGVDPLDPIASLNAAAKNMAGYVRKYGGYENALRAYNAGPGAIEKSKGYAETNNYVKTILGGKNPKQLSAPSGGGSKKTTTTTGLTYEPGVAQALQMLASPQRVRPVASAPDIANYAGLAQAPAAQMRIPITSGAPQRERFDQQTAAEALAKLGALSQAGTIGRKTTEHTDETGETGSETGGRVPTGSKVLELIYNDGGKGYGIKDGATVSGPQVYSGVWGGHKDHVHVAAGPKTVVALGKLAQRMGLRVGENPHFGGVNPVHVPGSYHNKGEAIDVSGDAKKMAAYAKKVAAYNRQRA
jgi:hypothetical protein